MLSKLLFQQKPFRIVQTILLTICLLLLTYWVKREDFISLISVYTVSFISYVHLCRIGLALNRIIFLGIALRLLVLFAIPNLSDDFYRFLWDGLLWNNGLNPYLHTPQALVESNSLPPLSKDIFPFLNSQNYFTVYLPFNQMLFAWPVKMFPNDLYLATICMKVNVFLFEIGTLLLLPKLLNAYGKPIINAAWYTLNPLIILELCGNGHFEAIMVFFLLLSLYLLKTNGWFLSVIAFSLAIHVKLIPLMFIPFVWNVLGVKKFSIALMVGSVISALMVFPFISKDLLINLSSSIGLYFQSFSFNSFFYSIVSDFSTDNISPYVAVTLALVPLSYIIYHSVKSKLTETELPNFMLKSQSLFYLFSAVVHPWYLATLVALNSLNNKRYVIAWSYLVFFSYFTYRIYPYEEGPALIALQYCVLFMFIALDYFRYKRRINKRN